jgi:hypothetical protein
MSDPVALLGVYSGVARRIRWMVVSPSPERDHAQDGRRRLGLAAAVSAAMGLVVLATGVLLALDYQPDPPAIATPELAATMCTPWTCFVRSFSNGDGVRKPTSSG